MWYMSTMINKEVLRLRREAAFWAVVDKDGPTPDPAIYGCIGQCWIWTGYVSPEGYGRCNRRAWGTQRAHVASMIISGSGLKPADLVMHKCDNRRCVRPDHLETGTQKKNIRDAMARGRFPQLSLSGENSHTAKLLDSDVAALRSEYSTGLETVTAIAKRYGISQSHASNLINHKRRSCITSGDNESAVETRPLKQ